MEKELFRAFQRDNLMRDSIGMIEVTKHNRERKLECWHPISGELRNDIYLYSFGKNDLPMIDVVCKTSADCEVYLMCIGKKSRYLEFAKTIYSEKNGFNIERAY